MGAGLRAGCLKLPAAQTPSQTPPPAYHVMSCHVMSCHVMSCHVMSCHVMSRHVTPFMRSPTHAVTKHAFINSYSPCTHQTMRISIHAFMNPCVHLAHAATRPPLGERVATAVTQDQARGYRFAIGTPSLEQRAARPSKQASKEAS